MLSQVQSDGRSTKDYLMDKHPKLQPLRAQALYEGPARSSLNPPVAFAGISADVIWQTIQRMSGSAGPSGLDVSSWKRICFSFSCASNDRCAAIALLGKRLCTDYVDPAGLEALVACWLIALDKYPGVRPNIVGECLMRLIGRAVVQCTKMNILHVIGD